MGLTILQPNAAKAGGPPILGIDLGTTYSLAAYIQNDAMHVVRDETGDGRVPSMLAFSADGSVAIGNAARAISLDDPSQAVYSIKRLIGKTLDELREELAYVPYQVLEREEVSGRKVLHVRIEEREHTPEELSSMILKEVAARASAELGSQVEKAVITVPAYFDESQRQATRDAGRIAGLDVVRIVNEPTAAALAYGLQKRHEGNIAVYDFGGGTFDCSILQVRDGVFKVLSTHGDTHLGGDDIDRAILTLLESEIQAAHPDMPLTRKARQHLRFACETLKKALTAEETATVDLTAEEIGVAFSRKVTRDELNALMTPLINRTLQSCRSALRDASLEPEEIDEVLLVGGSTRVPLVQEKVGGLFGRTPRCEINPDEVVAMGAAVQASILAGQLRQILLLDITPLSLGIETMGGAITRLIPRNSTIPAQATERFTTFVDNQTGVDIHIVQGEREMAADCRSLGKFKLRGIPPMPAGLPQIDVSFLIDANGMLQVSAKEIKSGQQAGIEIQPSHGLSREEVEEMIRSSIDHAKIDFERRRLAELRIKAQTNLIATQKGLTAQGEKLDPAAKEAIDNALSAVANAEKGESPDDLQKALDQLDTATQPLAELLMNQVLKVEVVDKNLSEF